MATLIIQSKSKANMALLSEMARRLGDKPSELTAQEEEDLRLSFLMKKEKTGVNVSRELIMEKLQ